MPSCAIITIAFLSVLPLIFTRHIESQHPRRNARGTINEDPALQIKSHLKLRTKFPSSITIEESQNKVLECQGGGSPMPSIRWMKNGKTIKRAEAEGRFLYSENVQGGNKLDISSTSSRLYLDCVSEMDAGEYACVAENTYHRTSTSTTLHVVPSEDPVECGEKRKLSRAPRIVSWTKTMLENMDQDTRFTCRAEGYPKPTIEWLGPNNEELSTADTNKYQIMANGDLVIRDLKWSDMGNYICIAGNVHGVDRTETFLYPVNPETR